MKSLSQLRDEIAAIIADVPVSVIQKLMVPGTQGYYRKKADRILNLIVKNRKVSRD